MPVQGSLVGADTTLVKGKGFSIRVSDALRKLRREAIYAPPQSFKQGTWMGRKDMLNSRLFRYKLMRELIADAVIQQESNARGLEPTEEEVAAYIIRTPGLNRFELQGIRMPGGALLPLPYTTLGFTLEDVRETARLDLRRERLRDKLLTEFSEEHFWETWRRDKERVEAVMVRVKNRPKSYEIESYVQNNATSIDAYYQEHPELFQTKGRTTVTLLVETDASSKEAIAEAQKRLTRGEPPEAIAAALRLKHKPRVEVVNAQDRRISNAAIGAIGVSTWPDKRKRVWLTRARTAPKLVPLSKGIKEEIAITLMQKRGIIPSARGLWNEAKRALNALGPNVTRDEAVTALASKKWEVIAPKQAFAQSQADFVPQVGVAPTLLKALFDANVGQVLKDPVLNDQDVWAARVLTHTIPKRSTYEAQKDRFKAMYLDAQKESMIDVFVARHAPQYVQETNVKALETIWGASGK